MIKTSLVDLKLKCKHNCYGVEQLPAGALNSYCICLSFTMHMVSFSCPHIKFSILFNECIFILIKNPLCKKTLLGLIKGYQVMH